MGSYKTALTTAVADGDERQVRDLVRSIRGKAVINAPRADGRTPLGIAVENRDCRMVEILVNAGADINKPCPVTALMQATVSRDEDMVEMLIYLKADVNFGVDFDAAVSGPDFDDDIWLGEGHDGGTPFALAARVDGGCAKAKGIMVGVWLLWIHLNHGLERHFLESKICPDRFGYLARIVRNGQRSPTLYMNIFYTRLIIFSKMMFSVCF